MRNKLAIAVITIASAMISVVLAQQEPTTGSTVSQGKSVDWYAFGIYVLVGLISWAGGTLTWINRFISGGDKESYQSLRYIADVLGSLLAGFFTFYAAKRASLDEAATMCTIFLTALGGATAVKKIRSMLIDRITPKQ